MGLMYKLNRATDRPAVLPELSLEAAPSPAVSPTEDVEKIPPPPPGNELAVEPSAATSPTEPDLPPVVDMQAISIEPSLPPVVETPAISTEAALPRPAVIPPEPTPHPQPTRIPPRKKRAAPANERRRPVMSPWQAGAAPLEEIRLDPTPFHAPAAPPPMTEPQLRCRVRYSPPALIVGVACVIGGMALLGSILSEGTDTRFLWFGSSVLNLLTGLVLAAIGVTTLVISYIRRWEFPNLEERPAATGLWADHAVLYPFLFKVMGWAIGLFATAVATVLGVVLLSYSPLLAFLFLGTPALAGTRLVIDAVAKARNVR